MRSFVVLLVVIAVVWLPGTARADERLTRDNTYVAIKTPNTIMIGNGLDGSYHVLRDITHPADRPRVQRLLVEIAANCHGKLPDPSPPFTIYVLPHGQRRFVPDELLMTGPIKVPNDGTPATFGVARTTPANAADLRTFCRHPQREKKL